MTPRSRYNFWIDDDQRSALTAIKEREGIPESEQIRRAIQTWVEKKGDGKKRTARKRVASRKRA